MGNCYKLGYSYSKKRIHELIHKGLKYEAETEQADIPNVTVKAIGIKISEEDKQSFEKRANQHFLKEELYQATKPTELTEDMAKALIMAKYDIGLDYFRNF